jgi:hypothetical protein
MSGQFHAPAASLPGKSPPYPLDRSLDDVENILDPSGIRTPTLWWSSPWLVAIPTTLSRLLTLFHVHVLSMNRHWQFLIWRFQHHITNVLHWTNTIGILPTTNLIKRDWVISDVKNCMKTSGKKFVKISKQLQNSMTISKQRFLYNRLWRLNSPSIIISGINLKVLSGRNLINAPTLIGWGPIFGIMSQTAWSPDTPQNSQCVPLANYITES